MSFVTDLFTGKKDKQFNIQAPAPVTFGSQSTPGGTLSNNGGNINFQRGQGVTDLLGGLTAGRNASTLGTTDLLARTAPGFSDFRTAGLNRLNDNRQRAISNLRSNLSNRGVLGSSFGQSALAQTDLQAGRDQAQFESQVGLQEIAATQGLIKQRLDGELNTISQELSQFNQEAANTGQFTAQQIQNAQNNAKLASDIAQFNAQIEAQQKAGRLKFISTVLGAGAGFATGGRFRAAAGAGGSAGPPAPPSSPSPFNTEGV